MSYDVLKNLLIAALQPEKYIRFLSKITASMSASHSAASFLSFLVFLVNGRYRTLTDRLLRMRLTTPPYQTRRDVSFEYLNRQLVWHAFTEFLLFLLPLVGINRWRRWLGRAWHNVKKTFTTQNTSEDGTTDVRRGELSFLPERTCAICYKDQNPISTSENEVSAVLGASGGFVGSAQTDVTNPYETTCYCVYCYVCLAIKLESEEGGGWTCLRCGNLVKECKPWTGDVLPAGQDIEDQSSVLSAADEQGHFLSKDDSTAPRWPARAADMSLK